MFRAFDNRPVSCRAAKRCLTPFKEMRYALRHQPCASLDHLPTQARWLDRSAFLKAIVAVIDVLQEALEMRRAAHRRYPFNNQ
jgi:hypothetical protein